MAWQRKHWNTVMWYFHLPRIIFTAYFKSWIPCRIFQMLCHKIYNGKLKVWLHELLFLKIIVHSIYIFLASIIDFDHTFPQAQDEILSHLSADFWECFWLCCLAAFFWTGIRKYFYFPLKIPRKIIWRMGS